MSKNNLKVTVINVDDYRKIKTVLEQIKSENSKRETASGNKKINSKMEYNTFQLKEDRSYRFVIRGLPSSIHLDDIKVELEEMGHEAKQITNIYKYVTNERNQRVKKEFPQFNVEIKQNVNNTEVFKIVNIAHCKVTVEPPRKTRGIPQCINCQQLGHTKSFCNREPRCVKCAEQHHYKDCKKPPDTIPTCALCLEKGHTANYKGCMIYQEKTKRDKINKSTAVSRIREHIDKTSHTLKASLNPNVTYAQAISLNMSSQKIVQAGNNLKIRQEECNVNENEIIKLLKQIQSSITILTTRVDKLESYIPPQRQLRFKTSSKDNKK